ncbi:Hypothetical predicted protein [Olea europaea subsp. europaea]|uniref:KIB1-4 beta-propeller domain-containing protein n=1 Tax=Olea europaea subsp. europaea TaxID=158383 RepID=A0A8S0QVV6_OLEEU|nr:Hypothetical predicted protein [Olea europaea subsp. europaea]
MMNNDRTNISVHSHVYQDTIFYNGKFYAVDFHGVVVVCDFDDTNGPKTTIIALALIETGDLYHKYLLESSEDLLLVSHLRKGLLFDDDEEVEEEDDVDDEEEEEEEGGDNEKDKSDVDGNDNVDED